MQIINALTVITNIIVLVATTCTITEYFLFFRANYKFNSLKRKLAKLLTK